MRINLPFHSDMARVNQFCGNLASVNIWIFPFRTHAQAARLLSKFWDFFFGLVLPVPCVPECMR